MGKHLQRLIMLTGLGRDQLHWKPLVSHLQSLDSDIAVETPDAPGAGTLHQLKSPLKVKAYIPFIEEQLSESAQEATLIGLSFGGMLALQWAKQSPERFKKIILINSSSRLNPFYDRLCIWHAMCHSKAILGRTISSKEEAIFKATCNTRPVDLDTIDEWVEIQRRHPVKFSNQLRQIIAASRFKVPEQQGLPPIHIIYSSTDRLVNPRCSERLKEYFGATFSTHDWAGHDLAQDDPEWVAKTLLEVSIDQ